MKNIYVRILPLFLFVSATAQNIGINTDGSSAETGVMLDVKAPSTNAKATTAAVQTFFQLKSHDADASALKLRLGFKTDATLANRYGFIDFLEAGTPTYLNLALQPSGGKVGIGTTAPTDFLNVYGNLSGNGITVKSLNGAGLTLDRAGTVNHYRLMFFTAGADKWAIGNRGHGNENLGFYIGGSAMAAITFDAVGNVGIGNTVPEVLLDLKGNNVAFGGQLRLAATDYAQISFYNSGALTLNATNRLGDIFYDITGTTLNIENNSGNKYITLNPAAGNVGIGNSAPAEKLHVTGGIRASSLAGTGTEVVAADANGTLQRTTISTSSLGGGCCDDWTLVAVANSTLAGSGPFSSGYTAQSNKEYLVIGVWRGSEIPAPGVATTDNVFVAETMFTSAGQIGTSVERKQEFITPVTATANLTWAYYCSRRLNGTATVMNETVVALGASMQVHMQGNGTIRLQDNSATLDMGLYIFEK